MFKLEFDFTGEDYHQMLLHHNFKLANNRGAFNRQRSSWAFLLGVIVFAYSSGIADSWQGLLIGLGISLAVALLAGLLYKRGFKRGLRENIAGMRKADALPVIYGQTMHFDNDSIHRKYEGSESRYAYFLIKRCMPGETAFYLYLDGASAFSIPYRAFADEEEKAAFLQFISAKTGLPTELGESPKQAT